MDTDPGASHHLPADALEQTRKGRVQWIREHKHMRTQQAPRLRYAPPVLENSALAAVLLVCSGAAWLVVARLTTVDMQVGLLTSPLVASSAAPMTAMGMPQLESFVGMWAV